MIEEEKRKRYERLLKTAESLLHDEEDPIVWMASISSLIQQELDHLWAGFYRVRKGELVIGPYQGTPGCLRIAFGRGVCGKSAEERRTLVVPDVHSFPGHIACDSRSNSEIVVPVFDSRGNLRAVLDIDSTRRNAFDEIDRTSLERLVEGMRDLAWTAEN